MMAIQLEMEDATQNSTKTSIRLVIMLVKMKLLLRSLGKSQIPSHELQMWLRVISLTPLTTSRWDTVSVILISQLL